MSIWDKLCKNSLANRKSTTNNDDCVQTLKPMKLPIDPDINYKTMRFLDVQQADTLCRVSDHILCIGCFNFLMVNTHYKHRSIAGRS